MLLNYIWIAFFLLALFFGGVQSLSDGGTEVFAKMVEALFSSANTGFEISIGLAGVLTLWQGILRIGERSGVVERMARSTGSFFAVLFPDIPKGHPVTGNMLMSFSANLLGLDNAATPLGLETMQQLQKLNRDKETASDAMIMYLCINASGLTILPITIIMYRLQLGSANPVDVFLPILLSTSVSTLVAIALVSYKQRLRILKRAFILPALLFLLLLGLLFTLVMVMDQSHLLKYSSLTAHLVLLGFIALFLISGLLARRNVYEDFIDGAKEGFTTAVKIIPYLVGILVAIGLFRASGGLEMIMSGCASLVGMLGIDARWVDALPTMLMKPLSGSGARGLMIDAMTAHGPDSFIGRLVCLVQGTTDTTFYIVALYFGSVAIKRTRYTVGISLLADLAGAISSVAVAYFFFG